MITLDNTSAIITGLGQVVFAKDTIAAAPGPGEALVKTHYSLVSPGTELAIFQNTHIGFSDPANLFAKYPFRPGYAAVGRVLARGVDVSAFGEGDWVFHLGQHCAHALLNVAKDLLLPLPEGLDPQHALYARMAQITASAREESSAAGGGKVIVLGLGLVGNLAAQLFLRRGCDVLGIDLMPGRCDIARRCGIRALHVTGRDIVAEVRAALGEAGAPTVIEATGHPQAAITALELTARRGEMILLGSTRGKVEMDVYKLIHGPGVTVRGAHENVLPPLRKREVLIEHLEEIASGRLCVTPLLSRVMDYSAIGEAYRTLIETPGETMSVVLQWAD